MPDRLLTMLKAAQIARIKKDTLVNKMRRKKIKPITINRRSFIKESVLLELIKIKNESI